MKIIKNLTLTTGKGIIRNQAYVDCTFTLCNTTTFKECAFTQCTFEDNRHVTFTNSPLIKCEIKSALK